jgi:hypothetical protein
VHPAKARQNLPGKAFGPNSLIISGGAENCRSASSDKYRVPATALTAWFKYTEDRHNRRENVFHMKKPPDRIILTHVRRGRSGSISGD